MALSSGPLKCMKAAGRDADADLVVLGDRAARCWVRNVKSGRLLAGDTKMKTRNGWRIGGGVWIGSRGVEVEETKRFAR